MRLSEVKGERVLDVIADIAVPALTIAEDPAITALFAKKELKNDEDAKSYAIERAKKAVPFLLKDHRSEVIDILAAIEGVTAEEYMKNVTLPSLIQNVAEILTDEDLLGFLA